MELLEILKTAEILICIALIIIILVQNKSVSLNLSTMSGSAANIKKRGPEKVMQNATIILGSLFILNSLIYFMVS